MLTVRHPLDFANSMLAYAPEIGLAGWSGIWLHYMAQALTACAGRPMALVDHDELTRHTPRALAALRNRLSSLGVPLTTPPAVAAERGTAEGAGSDGRERTASHESDGTASALSAELGLGAPPPRAQWLPSELALLSPDAARLHALLASAARLPADAPRSPIPRSAIPVTKWPTFLPRRRASSATDALADEGHAPGTSSASSSSASSSRLLLLPQYLLLLRLLLLRLLLLLLLLCLLLLGLLLLASSASAAAPKPT